MNSGILPFLLSVGEILAAPNFPGLISGSIMQAGIGRTLFGQDAQIYTSSRPPYPPRVYDVLRTLCPVGAGTRAFEVGPGTGQASEHLLALGTTLTAVEPDKRLADLLQTRMSVYADQLTILQEPFEDIQLAPASFDLGIAATSFHWLDTPRALAKVFELLRPGGCWAMWWSVFDDPDNPDAFRRRTAHLFDALYAQSSLVLKGTPFAFDKDRRIAEMTAAGLVDVTYEEIPWSFTFDRKQMVDLTSTFSPVVLTPEAARSTFLHELGEAVDTLFNGRVMRHFVTGMYTARRPL